MSSVFSKVADINIFQDGSIVEHPVLPTPPPIPNISQIKRSAFGVATLKPDWMLKRWNFTPRNTGLPCAPQTIVFNNLQRTGKGASILRNQNLLNYLVSLNGQTNADRILNPPAGWVNSDTSLTIERLSWSMNFVIVLQQVGLFSQIYAPNINSNLQGTFFDRDMRFVVHKFNAICLDGGIIKLGSGYDIYTPFVDDGKGMWILSEELEMWPTLPVVIDGFEIVEYEVYGYTIMGVNSNNDRIVLRDPFGYHTSSWRLLSPEVPI